MAAGMARSMHGGPRSAAKTRDLEHGITGHGIEETVAELTALLREVKLRHTVAARFPLEEIAASHQLVEASAQIGNVIIDIA